MRSLILCLEFLIIFLLFPNYLLAQSQTTPQKISDIASYGTVFSNIGLDTLHSFQSPDRRCALISESIKIGSTIAIAELLKRLIHEDRPDHSDNKSFPSEHTALAFATSGWSVGWGISLGAATGLGRIGANRHHWYDVLAGGSIGYGINIATSKAMNCREN